MVEKISPRLPPTPLPQWSINKWQDIINTSLGSNLFFFPLAKFCQKVKFTIFKKFKNKRWFWKVSIAIMCVCVCVRERERERGGGGGKKKKKKKMADFFIWFLVIKK